jgi:hypothetical protein
MIEGSGAGAGLTDPDVDQEGPKTYGSHDPDSDPDHQYC